MSWSVRCCNARGGVMNLAQEVEQHGGLYAFTCSEMARKRARMLPVSGQWYAPTPKSVHKGKGKIVVQTPTYEPPVKKFIPMSDCVSVEDLEPEVSADDPTEIGIADVAEAGQDEPEPDEQQEEGAVIDD